MAKIEDGIFLFWNQGLSDDVIKMMSQGVSKNVELKDLLNECYPSPGIGKRVSRLIFHTV